MRKMTLFETEKFGIYVEVTVICFTYIAKALLERVWVSHEKDNMEYLP